MIKFKLELITKGHTVRTAGYFTKFLSMDFSESSIELAQEKAKAIAAAERMDICFLVQA
jgi:chorismate synthase